MQLSVLQCGSCEPLKASVHGAALGLFAVMGLYNAAAWLSRREQHLAINAVLYAVLAAWEQQQVARHVAASRRCQALSQSIGTDVAAVVVVPVAVAA
jgi:ADP-ribosylglycohydrolase